MKRPVVIVGAGLFGSIAATLCARRGHRVTVIDDGRENAGSRPAACLIRPSWISGLGAVADRGLAVLRYLYSVKEIEFKIKPAGKVDVLWVDPQEIWYRRANDCCLIRGKASVDANGVVFINGSFIEGNVLLAAGVWTGELWNSPMVPKIRALAGCAFRFRGEIKRPTIDVWAPYKQTVAFVRDPNETWVGDGSAIIQKNWTNARQQTSLERCALYGGGEKRLIEPLFGLRPYVEGHKAGFFTRLGKNVWVSTGGAKNGTVIAAAQAARFVEDIQ